MADKIDWVVVENYGGKKQIGAVGFIGDKAVVVAAFYKDLDGNYDGKVSLGEWAAGKILFNLKNRAVTEVAMQARGNPDILERDPSYSAMAGEFFTHFATGLIAQGVYAAYFSLAVSAVAAPIAGRMASNMVTQFVIRKGMEATVKAAYNAAAL